MTFPYIENISRNFVAFGDAKGDKCWYSYDTLIAFRVKGELHILKNYWGPTTGKHLNTISRDKSVREDRDTFWAAWKRLTND